jgi:NADPH-dependent glutamate synthase beta subunit-like oxidoreductase
MKPFKHRNARSITEATRLLAAYKGKAKVNAGGTDLLWAMRDRCLPLYPEAVINIKTINGLDYIKKNRRGLTIGALTKLADIAQSSEVKEEHALLAEAARSVASPNVRNMATLGGNLAQDVRCWYYRYPRQIGGPIVCLRKGGKICSALAGDNRYHSLFGAARLNEYPCSSYCPAHTDIPSYLNEVRKGDLAGAARILMSYNPIPAVTGRVCPAFCEPECNRNEFDEPVAINCIERGMGDYILEKADDFYVPPGKESGRKVAIIGSGPAGLTAAFYLRTAGHEVTVYEKLHECGGMLRYSIPPFRLPKEVVRKQVKALEDMGITFKAGIDVGKDVPMEDLAAGFDAVFLAGGTWRSLKPGVAGEDAGGVLYALDYLKRINSGEKIHLGRTVIVIGGGSVALDAARTARRSGSGEVHLVCLECRDLSSKDRMLAQDEEILEAEEEGIKIHPSLGIKEIVTKDGKAVGLETVRCLSVREPDGAFNPHYDASCTALSLQGDSIIIAIGQSVDQSLSGAGIAYTAGGTISVDSQNSASAMKRVFAGGDIASGTSTVIQAVASARQAVRNIELSFGGEGTSDLRDGAKADFSESTFRDISRAQVREVPPSERVKTIDIEHKRGLTLRDVEREAGRCFNCGCLAPGPSDIAIALVALDARIITSKRKLPARMFFNASATSSTVLDADELIKEINIPRPPAGTVQQYEKFTLREPIDFAIASVASVVTINNGFCSDARIVLGGVAPEPLRARLAEEYLEKKPLDEDTAVKAGKLAVEGALPLSGNAYKIEIVKTLVKRAIMSQK